MARGAAVLAVGAALIAASNAEAADSFGYSASSDVDYVFQDITATGTRVLVDRDDGTFSAPIGFTFSFYGAGYTNAELSSNGVISFGPGTAQFSNQSLTTTQIPGGPSIFTYWDDLVTRTSSDPRAGVYYQTIGTAGNRLFIVQEIANAYSSSDSDSINFQTVLSEANGSVLMRYAATSFGNDQDAGASATVGIQGNLLNGQVVQWSHNMAGSIVPDASICFSLGGNCSAPLVGGVPEPATWAMLIAGVGMAGGALRRRKQATVRFA